MATNEQLNNTGVVESINTTPTDVNATPTPSSEILPETPSSEITNATPIPKEALPSNIEDASKGVQAVATNIAAQAQDEITSQKELTSQLQKIDVGQLETKVSNAESNFSEAEKIQTTQMLQKTQNELEYQQKLQEETDANVAAAKITMQAENELNAATAAEMKLKNDNAERDAEIANDVAQQQAAISFSKLGLSFSGAAINTSQQIYAQGARNIAELKASNAKNYADLQVKISRVEFDHQTTINKIISDANEKQFSSKERLREFIGQAQSNILLSRKEAQAQIQDAITTYKTEAQQREDKLYSDIQSANTTLLSSTKEIQTQVIAQETRAREQVDMLIKNGQWGSLSTVKQAEMEKAAGIPIGTSSRTATQYVVSSVKSSLKEAAGKDIAIPLATLNKMESDIKAYQSKGYSLSSATQIVTDKYKNTIPEFKSAMESKAASVKLAAAKTQAEIDKLISEEKQNYSEIDIAKAKLKLAQQVAARAGSGSSSTKAANFTTSDGRPLVVDKNGIAHTYDGKVYGAGPKETIKKIEGSDSSITFNTTGNSTTPTETQSNDAKELTSTFDSIMKGINPEYGQ